MLKSLFLCITTAFHMVKSRIFLPALALLCASAISAAPHDRGKQLFLDGDYPAALEELSDLVRRSPRDGNANYYLGLTLMAIGLPEQAGEPLQTAARRNVVDAFGALAERALTMYDVETASENLDQWETRLRRNRREIPQRHRELSSRLMQMKNMLDRVERIEIIDSIAVPRRDFFEAYRLSEAAGRILPPEAVERITAEHADRIAPAYIPQNRSEILWAQADSTDHMRLWEAGILDDGSLDHPMPMDSTLAEGADSAFPFLMPDGVTLYFANNGGNSLGGYDIFMTRRSDDADGRSYMQPQNIGMPYNSPYDDYMLAIDENSGLGWWATDRNRIPDSLTVYVFVPAQMRVNVEVSDPNLARLARLSDISLTRNEGVDYDAMLRQRLPKASPADTEAGSVFSIDIAGKVYTTLADFSNPDAKSAMAEYLAADAALRRLTSSLDGLRWKYAAGDRSVGRDIIEGEAEQVRLRKRMQTLRNSAVRMETKTR